MLNDVRGMMDDLAVIDYSRCLKKVSRNKTTRQRLCRRGHSLIVLAEGLIFNTPLKPLLPRPRRRHLRLTRRFPRDFLAVMG